MSNKQTRFQTDLKLILKITIVWMILGLIIVLYDYVTTSDNEYYLRTESYNFLAHMGSMVLGGFLGGIIGASFLVLYSTKKLRKQPFPVYVLVNSIAILILIFMLDIIVVDVVWSILNHRWFFEKEAIDYTATAVFNWRVVKSMGIWFTVALGTTFILRVNEKYGPGVLLDTIKGKYHKPVEEERIFMFLDIRSATTIAEKLGHHNYFRLLSDFYADITDAIFYSNGEIYQYVGDEVVVTWKTKDGLKNNNCLNCFFDAQKDLAGKSDKYLNKYSLLPEFKAGMHIGTATVGELGVLKKEIAFSGDVLNTASRIQNECNKYGTDLLISQDLLNKLEINTTLVAKKIGEIELRGKQKKTSLYAVKENRKTEND